MMYAASFLFERCFLFFSRFVRDWYVRGSARYWHWVLSVAESLDRSLALVITVKHLFMPLYGDYSVGGYVFGFIFRVLRTVAASLIYALFFALAAAAYAAWIGTPVALLLIFLIP